MRRSHAHATRSRRIVRRAFATMRLLSLILIIGPLVSVGPVQAQSSAPTTEPVFGIGDREFLYGGWNLAMPNACATRADSIDTASRVPFESR